MSQILVDRSVVEQALEALNYERTANNPLDWHHDKTMQALRAALEKPVEQDKSDNYLNGYCTGRTDLLAEQSVEQKPVVPQSIEAMAVYRYKVVPAHSSMFHRYAVVAGNGTQQLYIGREVECENMARKFAGAFLDGAYVMGCTHPQPRQPLTDEELRDALRSCPHDTVENLRVRWLYAKDFARAIEAAHGIKEQK